MFILNSNSTNIYSQKKITRKVLLTRSSFQNDKEIISCDIIIQNYDIFFILANFFFHLILYAWLCLYLRDSIVTFDHLFHHVFSTVSLRSRQFLSFIELIFFHDRLFIFYISAFNSLISKCWLSLSTNPTIATATVCCVCNI